jgi:hypothetical protein
MANLMIEADNLRRTFTDLVSTWALRRKSDITAAI